MACPVVLRFYFVDYLFSLERRRFRGGLILAHNIFHGRLDFPQAKFFEALAERNLRGHDFMVRHRSLCLLRGKATYSVRLRGPWNNPLDDIVNAPTLGTYKRLLDVAWPSLFPNRP